MYLVYSLNVTVYNLAIILVTTLSSYTGTVLYVVPGAAATSKNTLRYLDHLFAN